MNLTEKIFYAADKDLKGRTLNVIQHDKFRFGQDPVLLDLGCGDCKFTYDLMATLNTYNVITVDAVDVRVSYAENNGWKSIKADLNRVLPIESNSVDVIHAGDVIEHLNDTDIFIKEIKRVLDPGGYAIISTPNLASWHNIIALTLGKQPLTCMVSDEIIISEIEADKDMPKHRRIFTFDGLRKLIEFHGLKIEKSIGVGHYPFTGWVQKLLSKLDKN